MCVRPISLWKILGSSPYPYCFANALTWIPACNKESDSIFYIQLLTAFNLYPSLFSSCPTCRQSNKPPVPSFGNFKPCKPQPRYENPYHSPLHSIKAKAKGTLLHLSRHFLPCLGSRDMDVIFMCTINFFMPSWCVCAVISVDIQIHFSSAEWPQLISTICKLNDLQ